MGEHKLPKRPKALRPHKDRYLYLSELRATMGFIAPGRVVMVGLVRNPGDDGVLIDSPSLDRLLASDHVALFEHVYNGGWCDECVQLLWFGLNQGPNGGPVLPPPRLTGVKDHDFYLIEGFLALLEPEFEAWADDDESAVHLGGVPANPSKYRAG